MFVVEGDVDGFYAAVAAADLHAITVRDRELRLVPELAHLLTVVLALVVPNLASELVRDPVSERGVVPRDRDLVGFVHHHGVSLQAPAHLGAGVAVAWQLDQKIWLARRVDRALHSDGEWGVGVDEYVLYCSATPHDRHQNDECGSECHRRNRQEKNHLVHGAPSDRHFCVSSSGMTIAQNIPLVKGCWCLLDKVRMYLV